MAQIEETRLPGVGVRHDFDTDDGRRVGVITHAGGRRDLLVYSKDDPDACAQTLHLKENEAHALAEALGGTHVTRLVGDVEQNVDGLTIDWLRVSGNWSCAGRTLREVPLREKTGIIVVAAVREGETIPTPSPDFNVHVDDTLVVVGTPESVAAAAAMLRGD